MAWWPVRSDDGDAWLGWVWTTRTGGLMSLGVDRAFCAVWCGAVSWGMGWNGMGLLG